MCLTLAIRLLELQEDRIPPPKKIKLEETPGPAAVEIFLQDRDL